MPHVVPTLNQRQRIRELARAQGVASAKLAHDIGMPVELIDQLFQDERLLPDAQIYPRMAMYFWQDPGRFLSVDPNGPSLWKLIDRPERTGEPFPITVCGAGNLGHVFAGRLSARPEVEVRLLVSSPERAAALEAGMAVHDGILVRSEKGDRVGRPHRISADPAEVVPGSQLVLFCVPTHVQPGLLERVVPCLGEGAFLGAVPAVGGFHWLAQEALTRHGKRATVFGLISIPWMCKVVRQGEAVRIIGFKHANAHATLTPGKSRAVADLMAALTEQPTIDLGSFLQITLNPGNQLLHPGIMYSLFRDWQGEPYPWAESPLFYEGLSEQGAMILSDLSDELQSIKGALRGLPDGPPLELVLPLQMSIMAGYGDQIVDMSSLRSTIATNPAYAGIRTPMVEVRGGRIPDLSSRFFHEDVPFGLVVLRSLAQMATLKTPRLDEILTWCQRLMRKSYLVDGRLEGPDMAHSGSPLRFGLTSLADVVRTSTPGAVAGSPPA